jgi:hypothetical protein
MALALVVKRIGFNKKIGRAWLGVKYPEDHPKIKRKESQPPFETERHSHYELCETDEEMRIDFDDATTCNGYDRNEVNGSVVWETMIEPIIVSFVHQTSWTEDLRRFSKVAEAWMDLVKSLGVDFFETDGLSRCIWKLAKEDYEEDIQCYEWWKGFDETRMEHFAQFKITLEHFTRRLSQLINELDEVVLINTHPKSLEFARKQREWELLAVEHVQREGERACLFHHGTAGEYFYQSNNSSNNSGVMTSWKKTKRMVHAQHSELIETML